MKRIDWNQLDAAGRKAALARPQFLVEISAIAHLG